MRALRFAIALVVTALVHAAATRVWGDFPRAADLFLVLTVWNALGGSTLSGMFGGLAAGLAADSLSGGPYGLNGFADTLLGFGGAYLAQRVVTRRLVSLLLLFALAAAAQQAILVAVSLLLIPEPSLPDVTTVVLRAASTGVLGTMVYLAGEGIGRRAKSRRRKQSTKLR